MYDIHTVDHPVEAKFCLEIPLQEVFKKLYSLAGSVLHEDKTIWSPKLWTPDAQASEALQLQTSVKSVISGLKSESISLESVSWKQLEEIVAEVLRAQGLEIHIFKESPQGGRDVIARGELVPGQEPVSIAVEIKHKKVVGRPEVQTALWQNRMFPALMFVTSGRFSAGVLKEKALPENQLRLFLKDGEALGDLIRDYGLT
jgi:restriction endonuclease Mrr